MFEIPDNTIDLTITSPPYDQCRESKDYRLDIFDFNSIAAELYRITKQGGIVCWNVNDGVTDGGESGTSFRQVLGFMDIGFKLWDTMIYAKNSFSFPSKGRYHQTFEYIFILSKDKPNTFNPIKDRKNKYKRTGGPSGRNQDGSRRTDGGNRPQNEYGMRFNVWNYTIGGGHTTSDKIAYGHPAIMHEQLCKDLVISWSNENDVVFDPMAGSGTTLKAAKLLNRQYLGCEINSDYCEICKTRLNTITVA